jgi:hypothetical protein
VAALAVDGLFVPALLLIRALRLARPLMFKQGDITVEQATGRIEGAPTEAKERGEEFVESLAPSSQSQPSSTSGSRMFLAGLWKRWIEVDLEEAVRWFRMAAEQGDTNAQNSLGMCFKNGEGVAKDPAKAAEWLLMAAEQGNAKA